MRDFRFEISVGRVNDEREDNDVQRKTEGCGKDVSLNCLHTLMRGTGGSPMGAIILAEYQQTGARTRFISSMG